MIEHSENKIYTCFENEVGPEMLQSSVQEAYILQIIHRIRTETTHNQLHMVCAFGILAARGFEPGTRALHVNFRFQVAQIA